jgi:hypothetical protein
MDNESFLRGKLLFKLARRNCWGGKHTAFDNLYHGFKPKHHHAVEEIAEQLIKENFLLQKKAFYGLHVSLNPKFSMEIQKEIDEFLKKIEQED